MISNQALSVDVLNSMATMNRVDVSSAPIVSSPQRTTVSTQSGCQEPQPHTAHSRRGIWLGKRKVTPSPLTEQEKASIDRLQQAFNAQISLTKRTQKGYRFKVTSEQLGQSYRFKNLEDAEHVLSGGYTRNRSKPLSIIASRIPRFRDLHQIQSLGTGNKGAALVIDGGDDLAVSLENSGLPRKLVQIVQAGALYPVFIGLVHKGWSGAKEERLESLEAAAEAKEATETFHQDLKQLFASELKAKEAIFAGQDGDQLAKSLCEFSAFKAKLLSTFEASIRHPDNKELQQTLAKLKQTLHQQTFKLDTSHNHSGSSELNQLLKDLNQTELNPYQPECHEWLERLDQYQDQMQKPLLEAIAERVGPAMTESGLGSMYWGMVAFETRALTDLALGHSAQSVSQVLSSIGDGVNALGQAQMVFAGLSKTFLAAREAQSLNDWIQDLESLKKQDGFHDDQISRAVNMLQRFKLRERNAARWDAAGNAVLTLGQLCMILGGPAGGAVGLGFASLSYTGVSATIGGVALSQTIGQIWGAMSNIEEVEDPEVDDIHAGKKDEGASSLNELFQNRILNLFSLAQQRATPKVWLDLCLDTMKHPNRLPTDTLSNVKQRFANAKSDEHQSLYREALANMSSNQIKAHERFAALYKEQPTTAYLYLMEQLKCLQNDEDVLLDSPKDHFGHQVEHLFRLADDLGIGPELERRVVKKMLNRTHLLGSKFNEALKDRYLSGIETEKTKKAWQIPNPLSPITNLLESTEKGQKFLEKITPKLHWGHKETQVYTFNRDQWLNDLKQLDHEQTDLNPAWRSQLKDIAHSLFEAPISHHKASYFGKDKRNALSQALLKVEKPLVRSSALRPLVEGVQREMHRLGLTKAAINQEASHTHRLGINTKQLGSLFSQVARHSPERLAQFKSNLETWSTKAFIQQDALPNELKHVRQYLSETMPTPKLIASELPTKALKSSVQSALSAMVTKTESKQAAFQLVASTGQHYSFVKMGQDRGVFLSDLNRDSFELFSSTEEALKSIDSSKESRWSLFEEGGTRLEISQRQALLSLTTPTPAMPQYQLEDKHGNEALGLERLLLNTELLNTLGGTYKGHDISNTLPSASFDPGSLTLNADRIQRWLSLQPRVQGTALLKDLASLIGTTEAKAQLSLTGDLSNIERVRLRASGTLQHTPIELSVADRIRRQAWV